MTSSDADRRRAIIRVRVAHAYARMPPHLVFGPLHIRVASDGRFVPDDCGPLACVLSVPDPSGEPCDLVAWLPDAPSSWWLRTGVARILGGHNVERAEHLATPLLVHSTPARWLACGGRGVCVVDWSADLRLWLGGIVNLVADSIPLARRLDQALGLVDGPGQANVVSLPQPTSTLRIATHHGR